MMDMNFLNLIGGPAVAADSALPGIVGQAEEAVPGEFVNLLDLAGDMEVGEFQNQDADDWMATMLQQIQSSDAKVLELEKQNSISQLGDLAKTVDPELKLEDDGDSLPDIDVLTNLKMEAITPPGLAAMINLAVPNSKIGDGKLMPKNGSEQLTVGRKNTPTGISETQLLKDWTMRGIDSQAKMPLGPGENLPTAAAVQQWAQAIASGDLKSAEIVPDEEAPVVDRSGLALSEIIAPKGEVPKPHEVLSPRGIKTDLPVEIASGVVKKNPEPQVAGEPLKPMQAAVAANTSAVKSDKPEFVAISPKTLPHVQMAERAVESRKPANQSKIQESTDPVTAKEFMLQNEMGMVDHTARLSPKTAPAVVTADRLSSVEDRRVSHHAVDFVAEKIDALKAAGGGTLRVQLDPKDMGAVMLKVSSKGGIARVEIVAEKPATAAVLMQNRAELNTRLESSGIQAQLSIDHGGMEMAARTAEPNFSPKGMNMSSFDLLSLDRSGSSEGTVSSSAVRSTSAAAGSQRSGEGMSDSWSRDERREFAREQWNSSRQNKKTA
jgi:hypothetical protein